MFNVIFYWYLSGSLGKMSGWHLLSAEYGRRDEESLELWEKNAINDADGMDLHDGDRDSWLSRDFETKELYPE